MKNVLMGILLLSALPLSMAAEAKVKINLDIGIEGTITHVSPDGRFSRHRGGYVFVNTPRICNLTNVRLHIRGDNLLIQDFKVLFGNGDIQDIPTRERFAQNSYTNWKDLQGGQRCIEGFAVKARPDRDFDNARVVLQGLQQLGWRQNVVVLGSALVRDFNF